MLHWPARQTVNNFQIHDASGFFGALVCALQGNLYLTGLRGIIELSEERDQLLATSPDPFSRFRDLSHEKKASTWSTTAIDQGSHSMTAFFMSSPRILNPDAMITVQTVNPSQICFRSASVITPGLAAALRNSTTLATPTRTPIAISIQTITLSIYAPGMAGDTYRRPSGFRLQPLRTILSRPMSGKEPASAPCRTWMATLMRQTAGSPPRAGQARHSHRWLGHPESDHCRAPPSAGVQDTVP